MRIKRSLPLQRLRPPTTIVSRVLFCRLQLLAGSLLSRFRCHVLFEWTIEERVICL